MRAQHMLIQLGYGREMQRLNKIGHPTESMAGSRLTSNKNLQRGKATTYWE